MIHPQLDLTNVDAKKLKKQLRYLYSLQQKAKSPDLEGVINLLEHIQDQLSKKKD